MKEIRIGIVGAGNMGSAILRGLLKAHYVSPDALSVSDVSRERLAQLKEELRVVTTTDNQELVRDADVVILAVKPQMMDPVMGDVAKAWHEQRLLVSILAGVTTGFLQERLPAGARVVRAMPNTPATVLEGATAVARGARATDSDVDLARALFGCVGSTEEVPEAMMDAVTGLSGSGPAFVLLALEAMADGAVRAGMPRAMALKFAAQTMAGTARLLLSSGEHPAVLKDRVTSPAGTTIAGLMELEAAGVRHAFAEAVVRAAERAAELGRAARER